MLSIKMKSLSFSTGTGTYISLQIPAHLLPRAFFIIKALVYQNGEYMKLILFISVQNHREVCGHMEESNFKC